MEDIKYRHIRDDDNVPVATIAYKKENDRVFAALSRCNPVDYFEKSMGRTVAKGRLDKVEADILDGINDACYNLPHSCTFSGSRLTEDEQTMLFCSLMGTPISVKQETFWRYLDQVSELVIDKEQRMNLIRKFT